MPPSMSLRHHVKRIEEAEKPKPSPFTTLFGSFDAWVESEVLPSIEGGALDRRDMERGICKLTVIPHDWQRGGSATVSAAHRVRAALVDCLLVLRCSR
ncbi:hypothetical protein SAMN05518866_12852 [Sphingobium sp. YR768]|jgi:hypothetical protein|nr:hypothetical protein SAMN05518866_12852 [Sphingobium sp. YR768]